MIPSPFAPLDFTRGPGMKNRFMLAPLTNCQSHPDGRLSDEEFNWLVMRARGGFGLTMTCAAMVQPVGRGFPGQLGAFSDDHVEGLAKLASAIHAEGSRSSVQLHHAGSRADKTLVPKPVSASDDAEWNARGLTLDEVEQLRDDFIDAAVRVERAGFDGVELHGAHGYVLAQFLSAEMNRRDDRYGGSLENRARLIVEIVDGVRARCRPDFQLGLRLSPERFGMRMAEIVELSQELFNADTLDYLDLSLWDVTKEPEEDAFKGKSLLACFTGLNRRNTRLGCAGKVTTGAVVDRALAEGADFVLVGRAAILHHDFPKHVERDRGFSARALPVTKDYLHAEGVSPPFVDYMKTFKGFVEA
jgi:2,4-dienoyl-CoA reductase-like NADH-dependent reductase (Old Yellow Enzyme family)